MNRNSELKRTEFPKPKTFMTQTRSPLPRKSKAKPKVERATGQADQKTCMFVSGALRKFAEGKQCQMMSEWCNGDPEKTILCHSRRRAGAGTAQKPHDFWGYHGCSDCHANEDKTEDRELYDAIRRTQYEVFAHFGTLTPLGDTP